MDFNEFMREEAVQEQLGQERGIPSSVLAQDASSDEETIRMGTKVEGVIETERYQSSRDPWQGGHRALSNK